MRRWACLLIGHLVEDGHDPRFETAVVIVGHHHVADAVQPGEPQAPPVQLEPIGNLREERVAAGSGDRAGVAGPCMVRCKKRPLGLVSNGERISSGKGPRALLTGSQGRWARDT